MIRLLGLWLALWLVCIPASASQLDEAHVHRADVQLAPLPPPPRLVRGQHRTTTATRAYSRSRSLFATARVIGVGSFAFGATALTLGVLEGSLGGVIIGVVLGGAGLGVAGVAAVPGQVAWAQTAYWAKRGRPPGPTTGAGYASLTLFGASLALFTVELLSVRSGGAFAAIGIGCFVGSYVAAEVQQRATHHAWLESAVAGNRRSGGIRARLLPNGLVGTF